MGAQRYRFGIRVSGLGDAGSRAAETPRGLYFPGFAAGDANRTSATADHRDRGLGASPWRRSGDRPVRRRHAAEALEYTRRMYEITSARARRYRLPTLDFGNADRIDVRLVVQTGILPRLRPAWPPRGRRRQVGGASVNAPRACFERAFEALAQAGRDRSAA